MKQFLLFFSLLLSAINSIAFSGKASNADYLSAEMHKKGTYKHSCPVPPTRLKEVTFSYYDFEGKEHSDGQIIVMDAVANKVLQIFHELYDIKFPIHKSQRIELYDGDDERSLADNNTSSFNCREMTGGSELPSIHAYGLAIDINPWQNPYVGTNAAQNSMVQILPNQGTDYLNRNNLRPGMAEQIVATMAKYGFTIWGGRWNSPIDWQHFQPPRSVAKLLAVMQPQDAEDFFTMYAQNTKLFNKVPYSYEEFIDLYKKHDKYFMNVLKHNFDPLNELEPTDAAKFIEEQITTKL